MARRRAPVPHDTLPDQRPRSSHFQVEDYLYLCLRYRELPVIGRDGPEASGPHAYALRARRDAELRGKKR